MFCTEGDGNEGTGGISSSALPSARKNLLCFVLVLVLTLESGGDGWLKGRSDSSCSPFACKKTCGLPADGSNSGDGCGTSLAWKNMGCGASPGETVPFIPPTTLVGLLFPPDPNMPNPNDGVEFCLPKLPPKSTVELDLVPLGVPLGVV